MTAAAQNTEEKKLTETPSAHLAAVSGTKSSARRGSRALSSRQDHAVLYKCIDPAANIRFTMQLLKIPAGVETGETFYGYCDQNIAIVIIIMFVFNCAQNAKNKVCIHLNIILLSLFIFLKKIRAQAVPRRQGTRFRVKVDMESG